MESLDSDQAESNLIGAARLCGPEATGIEIKKREWRNGIKLFIYEYSGPCTDPTATDVKWKKPSPGDFDSLGKYFTAKDIQALEAVFRDYHEVMPSELEAITGKSISLSED